MQQTLSESRALAMRSNDCRRLLLSAASCLIAVVAGTAASLDQPESKWIALIGRSDLGRWRKPWGDWVVAGDVHLDPANPALLATDPGQGVIVNGPTGRTRNLFSMEDHGDLELQLEFLIPRGSNSGVKLQGLYEVQITDSQAATRLTGSDCGGIYPRAELLPRYHHLDDGQAPLVNAARPAGEWQTLELVFRAPRFDAKGKKTANARLDKVTLNGKLVHANQELRCPTGHAWRLPEVRRGPLMLQADHGPVAFRNIRVRNLE